jgi:DNA repair protein RadD
VWPEAPTGVYCAGLNRREYDADLCLASIQSLYKRSELFGRRNLVMIDEAHLVPQSGEGMYRTALEHLRGVYPRMRVAGLTATPYRLDYGRLDEGVGRLFDKVVYSYGIGEAIADEWLVPLVAGATTTEIDTEGVARRNGGDFITKDLEEAADIGELVAAAADEIVGSGRDRQSWLCFCAGVRHAGHVREALRARGVVAETVTGETPGGQREAIFDAFRAGEIRALTGANVFTTGFDISSVDLIAMLRPTLSTGLYVQMLGRGTRKHPGKTDCLVLDFAGNVKEHGFVDAVKPNVQEFDIEGGDGTGRRKFCDACHTENSMLARWCKNCGHPFVMPHGCRAATAPLLQRDVMWKNVDYYTLDSHESQKSGRLSLRVRYTCGAESFDEWLVLERPGPARDIAIEKWIALGGQLPAPVTVEEAVRRRGEFFRSIQVYVQRDGQYNNVVGRRPRPRKSSAA